MRVGCAGQAPVPGSAAPRPAPSRVPWPERGVLRVDARLLAAGQVLDLAAGILYALVPRSQGVMTSRQGLVVAVLAADPTAREVAAVVSDGGYTGVVAISSPRACWSPRPT
jgi:hypothetical protein